ncbi:class I SAM-dependent methyltransferase [Ferruginibacter lapsinanis]|uniref:class I SAM-dependent methyltransferase n=1 Tax=Ferruginibacter lapsinanis TaxID=563172 RepID=UPI001E2C69C1|nr:class I SAM-dependent methyltransferase [Ferruginibacter lapsinanis]UEG50917.1 class I SAM-dependent methyltransferase [Ferruginibacter lapsinanis]
MRKEMPRLKGVSIKKKSPDYIHLYFLMTDLKEAINNFTKGKLLDLGCGNKPYKEWYQPLTTESTGCDATQSTEQLVDTICLATDLPYETNTFDTVISTQVLEHVYDHHSMIKEAYRVLKPQGNIILTVPFTWELHEEPYDFFRISKHGLKELFEEAGFEINYIKANGGKWAAMFQMMLNTVYSTFKYKTVKSKILKLLFIELKLTWLINHIAIWADKKYRDDIWTINYIVVAKKI